MKGFGSTGTSDGRASPDGFIRLIRAEIWMAHPRGPKEMKYEVSALIKRINRLYGPYTRETASSDNYTAYTAVAACGERSVSRRRDHGRWEVLRQE